MSLNWDVIQIKDYENVCYEPVLDADGNDTGKRKVKALTDAMIWACLHVGMRGITRETAAEFFARLHLWQKVYGPLLFVDGEPYQIVEYDVAQYIGLDTNVTAMSRATFLTATVRRELDHWKAHADRTINELVSK